MLNCVCVFILFCRVTKNSSESSNNNNNNNSSNNTQLSTSPDQTNSSFASKRGKIYNVCM